MSLTEDVTKYYAERSSVYDDTAGCFEEEAEKLRAPIKERFRSIFAGHDADP